MKNEKSFIFLEEHTQIVEVINNLNLIVEDKSWKLLRLILADKK